MKIYSGTSNKKLSKLIFDQLLIKGYDISENSFNSLQIDKFLDGEILPIFNESIRNQDIFFIQSTNTSENIIETLLVQDACKRQGVKSFTLIAPFQGYSRQDRKDFLRASIGSRMLADVLEKMGLSQLITIDLHNNTVESSYGCPVIHLNGNKIFIDYIKSLNLKDIVICSPDFGAMKRAQNFQNAFPNSGFAVMNKKRLKPNEIHSMELISSGEISGRDCLILDDLIDTGNTLIKCADILLDKGANSVRACATHGVLSGKSFENIENSNLIEIIVSDTIENDKKISKLKVISCSELISSAMNRLFKHQSISELNTV